MSEREIEAMLAESVRTLKAENDALEGRLKALEDNRRPMISGVSAEEMGVGFGLVALGGAFVVSRRKRSFLIRHPRVRGRVEVKEYPPASGISPDGGGRSGVRPASPRGRRPANAQRPRA